MQERYYSGIDDMWLDNWVRCHAGDLTATRKDPKKGHPVADLMQWTVIRDSYIKRYGLEETFAKWLQSLKKLAELQIHFIEKGDRFSQTKVQIQEARMRDILKSKGEPVTVDKVLTYLGEMQHYQINKKTTTVSEYFELVDKYQQRNKPKSANA